MPRSKEKLNVTALERSAKYRKPGMYGDGGGLWLLVKHEDARSWVFRYMLDRQARAMGLGAYPDVSLSSARDGHVNQLRHATPPNDRRRIAMLFCRGKRIALHFRARDPE